MPPRTTATRLEKWLVLHRWVTSLLGYGSTAELLSDMRDCDEGFGARHSHLHDRLLTRSSRLRLSEVDLERYDENIGRHLAAINRAGRAEPITLRYFQHLALLYAEIFLDWRANCPEDLLRRLNEHAAGMEREAIRFEEGDLEKLAFWMATGSGKTLVMHLNLLQFLHYDSGELDNIVLVTPNEGLSDQHIEEMRKSGIPCERFSASSASGGLGFEAGNVVKVIEITKLTEKKRGSGESVDVRDFEGRNLVLVDEGHKGSAAGLSASGERAWRRRREVLAEGGFTMEYSATFGQALTASRDQELIEEYGKAILFDYSYRYFYEDGFGKDFEVLNLKNQDDSGEKTDLLLTGNLLSFYEQRRYFSRHKREVTEYMLEPPLWTFVGSSVNAVYTKNRKKRSDVFTVVAFLHRFLADRAWAEECVGRVLRGETGLLDTEDDDVFAERFDYLKSELGRDANATEVRAGVLREVFHAESGGTLRVAIIRGSEGELGLRASGASEYFGLVYIGDTSSFKTLLEEQAPEIVQEEDAFSDSLFDGINDRGSRINVLIGARKFIEGWSSWRVSAMGLLNIGRSEGSQIIQLFGRGVRLKGKGLSLKRSSFENNGHPAHLRLLETLGIFAVEAGYMAQFREYLWREDVDPDGFVEIPLPIRRRDEFLDEGLIIPTVPEGQGFREDCDLLLEVEEGLKVSLDLASKAEATAMGGDGLAVRRAQAGEEQRIGDRYLAMLDWSTLHLGLVAHKDAEDYLNLVVPRAAPREIMEHDPPIYSLVANPGITEPKDFAGTERLQEVVATLLRKYVDKFYAVRRRRWETELLELGLLTANHPNFADYKVRVRSSEEERIEQVKRVVEEATEIYNAEVREPSNIHFDRHLYQPLLLRRGEKIKSAPPGLYESEETFVKELRAYCEASVASDARGSHPSGAGDAEIFLLRNHEKSGVGFFRTSGFYPDFILWVKRADGSQKVVFVEPHGMRNEDPPPYNEKVDLYLALRDVSDRISQGDERDVFLDSYIVSTTPYEVLGKQWGEGWTRERFAGKHILFEDDLYSGISELLAPSDELERRIFASYPYPLACGFRALMDAGDPRDLYREQLRFAENVLAFLASVSLGLLRIEDRDGAGLDPRKYWSGGISPGDWKEIIQRTSKVFGKYRDVPLAAAIKKLNIGSEKKGFGRDVIELIRAKNDYKHDRGPKDLESMAEASKRVQDKLWRCMDTLAYLTDYPMLRVKDVETDPDGGFSARCLLYTGASPVLHAEDRHFSEAPAEDELFLDLGDETWVSLYPFIVPGSRLGSTTTETYFIDSWDTKRGSVRLKSFERGHTAVDPAISTALVGWENGR